MIIYYLLWLLLAKFILSATTVTEAIATGTVDELDDAVEAVGGYEAIMEAGLLHQAVSKQRLEIFLHLLDKGFTVDSMIPGLNMPVYRFIITMKSTPIRDVMLRIAYETSDRMLEDYYRPMFKKTGWDVDAAEAMKMNDFLYIDRILNRHKAHPHNVILNQGLMLHSAILNDCPECVRLILKAGADPNHPYVGSAAITDAVVGKPFKIIRNWTPLMMAVVKGNMRVIDALLESPTIQVCKGLPGQPMHTARSLFRELEASPFKFEILKKLHARAGDKPILEDWIKGVSLQHLEVRYALQKKNVKFLEFLLHNCVLEIDPEWIKYAVKYSSAECLEILIYEYPSSLRNTNLKSLIAQGDPESGAKLDAINSNNCDDGDKE